MQLTVRQKKIFFMKLFGIICYPLRNRSDETNASVRCNNEFQCYLLQYVSLV